MNPKIKFMILNQKFYSRPAMSAIFVYWAPAKDRTKMLGSSTSGAWVGNIIALPLGGFLCVYGFDGGWPTIFYIFGIQFKIQLYQVVFDNSSTIQLLLIIFI